MKCILGIHISKCQLQSFDPISPFRWRLVRRCERRPNGSSFGRSLRCWRRRWFGRPYFFRVRPAINSQSMSSTDQLESFQGKKIQHWQAPSRLGRVLRSALVVGTVHLMVPLASPSSELVPARSRSSSSVGTAVAVDRTAEVDHRAAPVATPVRKPPLCMGCMSGSAVRLESGMIRSRSLHRRVQRYAEDSNTQTSCAESKLVQSSLVVCAGCNNTVVSPCYSQPAQP